MRYALPLFGVLLLGSLLAGCDTDEEERRDISGSYVATHFNGEPAPTVLDAYEDRNCERDFQAILENGRLELSEDGHFAFSAHFEAGCPESEYVEYEVDHEVEGTYVDVDGVLDFYPDRRAGPNARTTTLRGAPASAQGDIRVHYDGEGGAPGSFSALLTKR